MKNDNVNVLIGTIIPLTLAAAIGGWGIYHLISDRKTEPNKPSLVINNPETDPEEPKLPVNPVSPDVTNPEVPTPPKPAVVTNPEVPTPPAPAVVTNPEVPTPPKPAVVTNPEVPTPPKPAVVTNPEVPTSLAPEITSPYEYELYMDDNLLQAYPIPNNFLYGANNEDTGTSIFSCEADTIDLVRATSLSDQSRTRTSDIDNVEHTEKFKEGFFDDWSRNNDNSIYANDAVKLKSKFFSSKFTDWKLSGDLAREASQVSGDAIACMFNRLFPPQFVSVEGKTDEEIYKELTDNLGFAPNNDRAFPEGATYSDKLQRFRNNPNNCLMPFSSFAKQYERTDADYTGGESILSLNTLYRQIVLFCYHNLQGEENSGIRNELHRIFNDHGGHCDARYGDVLHNAESMLDSLVDNGDVSEVQLWQHELKTQIVESLRYQFSGLRESAMWAAPYINNNVRMALGLIPHDGSTFRQSARSCRQYKEDIDTALSELLTPAKMRNYFVEKYKSSGSCVHFATHTGNNVIDKEVSFSDFTYFMGKDLRNRITALSNEILSDLRSEEIRLIAKSEESKLKTKEDPYKAKIQRNARRQRDINAVLNWINSPEQKMSYRKIVEKLKQISTEHKKFNFDSDIQQEVYGAALLQAVCFEGEQAIFEKR